MKTLLRDLKILKGLLLHLAKYLLLIDITIGIIAVLFRTNNVSAILTNSNGDLLSVFVTVNVGFVIATLITYFVIWRKEIQEEIDNDSIR